MEVARPALIVSFFLAAVTLWYTGQWGGKDPRAVETQLDESVAAAIADADRTIARR